MTYADTRPKHWPKRRCDLKGRMVKGREPMVTHGGTEFDPDEVFEVTNDRGPIALRATIKCAMCGDCRYIKGIHPGRLELLPLKGETD